MLLTDEVFVKDIKHSMDLAWLYWLQTFLNIVRCFAHKIIIISEHELKGIVFLHRRCLVESSKYYAAVRTLISLIARCFILSMKIGWECVK